VPSPLGDRLVRRGVVADLFIVGGAASERFFPNEPLPARSRAMLEDLFDSA
jgi:hypothetical protein